MLTKHQPNSDCEFRRSLQIGSEGASAPETCVCDQEVVMYNVIMVPTDGTGFDREAIRVALRLAERTDAKVRLVRVIANGSLFAVAAAADGTAAAAQLVRSERDRALAELYALAAECRMASIAAI